MIIRSGSKSLTFDIYDYQYEKQKSKEKGYDYDANWLIVEITYADENGPKQYRDPCLLTYELKELIDGASEIVSGKETLYISDFMEPYLKIAIAKTEDNIVFGMEFVYDTTGGIWKCHKLSEVLSKESAQKIIEELKALFNRFPER